MALCQKALADLSRHVVFAATDEPDLTVEQRLGDAVRRGASFRDRFLLVGIFHRAEWACHPRRPDEGGVGHRPLKLQQKPRPGAIGKRHAPPFTDQIGDNADGIVCFAVGVQRKELLVDFYPRRFEPRDDQGRVGVGSKDEHRRALEGHRLVAGEPRQVRADREQQDVDLELVEAGTHLLSALPARRREVDPVHAGIVSAVAASADWRA